MQVTATLKNLRIAPRKARLAAEMIKGLDANDALNQLDVTIKGGCLPIKKLLESALANGENNFGVDRDNMYVLEVMVDAGPTLKRWMPKAYGRAGMIRKRTSKVNLILEERVEGKGRKSKEELEKEREKRQKEKEAHTHHEHEHEHEHEEKKEEVKEKKVVKGKGESAKKGQAAQSGWGSKIFRRKSM